MKKFYLVVLGVVVLMLPACGSTTYISKPDWNTREHVRRIIAMKGVENEMRGVGEQYYGAVTIGASRDTVHVIERGLVRDKSGGYNYAYHESDSAYIVPFRYSGMLQSAIDKAESGDTVIAVSKDHSNALAVVNVTNDIFPEIKPENSGYRRIRIEGKSLTVVIPVANGYCFEIGKDSRVTVNTDQMENCWIVNRGELVFTKSDFVNSSIVNHNTLDLEYCNFRVVSDDEDNNIIGIVNIGELSANRCNFDNQGLIFVGTGAKAKISDCISNWAVEAHGGNVDLIGGKSDLVVCMKGAEVASKNTDIKLNGWRRKKYCNNIWTSSEIWFGVYKDMASKFTSDDQVVVFDDYKCQAEYRKYEEEVRRKREEEEMERRRKAKREEQRKRAIEEENARIRSANEKWKFSSNEEFVRWIESGVWDIQSQEPDLTSTWVFKAGDLYIRSADRQGRFDESYHYRICNIEENTVRIALYKTRYDYQNACNSHSSLRFITRTSQNEMLLRTGTTLGASDFGAFFIRKQ